MGRLTFLMNMSLDGFIEGPDRDLSWSNPDEELHRFFNGEQRETDIQLYGRRLYETMDYWRTVDAETCPTMRPSLPGSGGPHRPSFSRGPLFASRGTPGFPRAMPPKRSGDSRTRPMGSSQ